MEYHSVSNPTWADASRQMIVVELVFPSLGDTPVKFNASASDVMDYGREIHAALLAGTYGTIADPVQGT